MTIVTRSGQITLDKEIREALGIDVGTPLEMNRIGDHIIIKKKDSSVWRKSSGFLPKDFAEAIKGMHKDYRERMKELNQR